MTNPSGAGEATMADAVEVSANLERAARALFLAVEPIFAEDGCEPSEADYVKALPAALLAFLTLDDAGVERLARALQQVNEQNGGAPYDALPSIYKHAHRDLRDQVAALLTELRLMAGEKE